MKKNFIIYTFIIFLLTSFTVFAERGVDFEKIDKDGNNFYHYTNEITQADLLKLVDGKDYLVTKVSEVLA